MDSRSRLSDPKLAMLICAVLVKRLGGVARVSQDDINDVAFNKFNESEMSDGSLEFQLVQRAISG